MKHNLPLILLLILTGCAPKGPQDIPSTISNLDTLVDKRNYFRLEQQVAFHFPELSEARRWYYGAIVNNAFNQNEACVLKIDSFINAPHPTLSDSVTANLLTYQEDSYFKLGLYAKAAAIDSLLIGKYQHYIDSPTLATYKNQVLLRNALKNIPAQSTQMQDSSVISWTRNGIGLIEIPLTLPGQQVKAIFDTRANISTITESYAQKLHLQRLNVTYQENAGVTGATFNSSLGIADSIQIGHALIRHAVFQVMPDTILYLAPIKYQLNMILGFPVIAQLKEIRIYKDGRMVIPQHAVPSDMHNMAMEGMDPFVYLPSGNDSLLLYFDSGAGNTILYAGYYEKHKAEIERTALKKQTAFGGAGGVKVKDTYILPSLSIGLSGKNIILDSVNVLTQKIFPGERIYGNLGQDFMKPFDEFILNFEYMYMKGVK
jgi:predicted aspartyl protease